MPSRPHTPMGNDRAFTTKDGRYVPLGFRPNHILEEFGEHACSDPEDGHYRDFVNNCVNKMPCDEGDDFDVMEQLEASEVP